MVSPSICHKGMGPDAMIVVSEPFLFLKHSTLQPTALRLYSHCSLCPNVLPLPPLLLQPSQSLLLLSYLLLGLPPALPQVTNKKNDLDASSFSSPPVPRCSPQLCLPLSGKPLSSVAPVEPAPPLPSPRTALGLPPSHSTLVLSQSPSATLSLHLCSRQHSRTPLSADTPR